MSSWNYMQSSEDKRIKVLSEAVKREIAIPQEHLLMIYDVRDVTIVCNNSREHSLLNEVYPSISIPSRSKSLFFIDGYKMMNFVKEGMRAEEEGLDYDHKVLGIYLGYPPAICKWFVENSWHRKKPNDRVGINYHGITFSCPNTENAINYCLKWMKKNRPVPVKIQTGVRVILPVA